MVFCFLFTVDCGESVGSPLRDRPRRTRSRPYTSPPLGRASSVQSSSDSSIRAKLVGFDRWRPQRPSGMQRCAGDRASGIRCRPFSRLPAMPSQSWAPAGPGVSGTVRPARQTCLRTNTRRALSSRAAISSLWGRPRPYALTRSYPFVVLNSHLSVSPLIETRPQPHQSQSPTPNQSSTPPENW